MGEHCGECCSKSMGIIRAAVESQKRFAARTAWCAPTSAITWRPAIKVCWVRFGWPALVSASAGCRACFPAMRRGIGPPKAPRIACRNAWRPRRQSGPWQAWRATSPPKPVCALAHVRASRSSAQQHKTLRPFMSNRAPQTSSGRPLPHPCWG